MNIREIRKRNKMTQGDLAKLLGVTTSAISRYENGTVQVPYDKLEKIAEIFNIDVQSLSDNDRSQSEAYCYVFKPDHSFVREDVFLYGSYDATAIVMSHINGCCELCGEPAPFINPDGTPYLESHFVDWLSEGGFAVPTNLIMLCPNCHKKVHVLKDKETKEKMLEIASKHKW